MGCFPQILKRKLDEIENSGLWGGIPTADTHYIQGEGGEELLGRAENLVIDAVRACGHVCTCASNTMTRVTFATCGLTE